MGGFRSLSCGTSEAEVIEECIQRMVDCGIELVELCASLGGEGGIVPDRLENGGCEWRVDAMGELLGTRRRDGSLAA